MYIGDPLNGLPDDYYLHFAPIRIENEDKPHPIENEDKLHPREYNFYFIPILPKEKNPFAIFEKILV